MFWTRTTKLIVVPIYLILISNGLINSLYFYLDAGAERCFIEDLPLDTIVNGKYKGEEYDNDKHIYHINPQLGVQITVTEVETQEKVVNTRGIPEGKFTFTSHGAGEHSICLRTNYTGGWFSTPQVKMHLDISVGESVLDADYEKEHVKDLAGRVKELNNRLQDIRREQQFQREREIQFRDLSEKTNHRAVWWSLVQIVVLFYMCVWQLRHLRGFFESKNYNQVGQRTLDHAT
ncbi:hypothetical protein KEM48_011350 [Puccinia striiformis f. sp. tritici PST-130]|nr:hypothetical protein H4Q26_011948 [Puccinia striiformis f. sp. tritici PST-130]KAI9628813.1 hypothetical protein KEM48_011350 [Puccinia striiformis f. sp. tritici PST-130]